MAKEISNLITFNTYKFERGGLLVDMFNQFNARVGDQGTELAIQWETSKTETKINLKERGLHFFAAGSVGQYLEKLEDGTGFKMSADASTVEWEDKDGAGSLDDGITVAKLPKQFFPQKGIFFGYFGLKDNQGNVFTSVNVWFRVLGGVPTMGAAIPYFVTEFDEVLERCNGKIVDALAELREKYQAEVKKNEDMSAETRAALSKLADSVGAIQSQIDAGNVVTLSRHLDDYKELNSKIDSQLAQMDLTLESFKDLAAIEAAYPQGKKGLFLLDDGHRAVYRDGKWIDAGAFQAGKVKDDDVANSMLRSQNYFTDPTFTVDKPFTDDKTVLTVRNINGTNWLHVESQTNGGIGIEAHNTNDSLFQFWAKRLKFALSNHTNQSQTFSVEVHTYNVDNNAIVDKFPIGKIVVKPLTAYHADLKFTLHDPGFTNRYYRIFIFSSSANTDYDIACPVLKNDYAKVPPTNNLLDLTNSFGNIGAVTTGIYYEAGKRYCNVVSSNSTVEDKGAQQSFTLEPFGFGYGDKFKVKTEIRNEGTPGVIIVELRYLNSDGSIGSSQLVSRTILGASQSVEIDQTIKLSTTENAKDYRLASLAIYQENTGSAHLLVNLDKTRVSYMPSQHIAKDNLFGDWVINHTVSDGSTATDYYNGAKSLNVYLAGVADYSTFTLPISYSGKGMIDIDAKLVSTIKTKLKFELNEYSADGSLRHVNELRPETLLPNIARTVHITYNVTDTDGDYYALVIYSQKEQLSFSILSATAQIHDSSRPLGDSSLPQVNLLANLDEGGATAKGKVELIRGDTSHLYFATFKIQGQSTKTFPKKAWRITFYTDDTYTTKLPVRVFPDYPDVDALNMKSNYIDWTQANNVLVSRCIADLTKLSDNLEPQHMAAPNQCEITGEPCLGFNNGQKLGLFTLSPKKSNIMFNMEKGNTKMAVFEGNNVTEENCFKADSTVFGDDAPFTIEAPDDDVDQSLKDSFNALLKLVNSSSDDDFKAQIGSKLNLQSAANWIVSVIAFGLYDDVAKNICWATWDGIKWSAVQYDHDMAFGLWWDGSKLNHEESDIDLPYLIKFSRLFERLIKLHLIDDQLISAWNNLKTAHPIIELQKEFRDWYYKIGDVNYEEDQRIWPDMPGQHYFHGEHVLNYITKRYKHCDKWFTKDYLATL